MLATRCTELSWFGHSVQSAKPTPRVGEAIPLQRYDDSRKCRALRTVLLLAFSEPYLGIPLCKAAMGDVADRSLLDGSRLT